MTASTREARGLADRRGLAAAGIATVGLTAPALAAEAADAATYTKGFCYAHRLCVWSQGGFANNWKNWSSQSYDSNWENNLYDYLDLDSEDRLGDSVSSVWNNTVNKWAMLFEHDTYGGHRICFPPGTAVRDLHNVKLTTGPLQLPVGDPSWGNRISSHRMYTYRPSDCTSDGSTMVPEGQKGCSM
jgi:hypothetical protein